MRIETTQPMVWRRELLYLMMGLMELSWTVPWFIALTPGAMAYSGFRLAAFASVNYLASLSLIRLMENRQVGYVARIAVFLPLIAGAVALGLHLFLGHADVAPGLWGSTDPSYEPVIPPSLAIVATVAFLWWRGIRIGTLLLTPARVSFGLRFGILALILAALAGGEDYARRAMLLTPPLFFSGLVATGMARSANLKINRAVQRTLFGPQWVSILIGTSALVTGVGFGLAVLLGGVDVERLKAILYPVGVVIVAAFLVLMTPIFLLIQAVASLIRALIVAVAGEEGVAEIPTLEPVDVFGVQTGSLGEGIGPFIDFASLARCAIITAVLTVAVLLVVLALRRRARHRLEEGEERESLGREAILDGLRKAWERMRERFERAVEMVSKFGWGRDLWAALTVRRIYARMAALAADRGHPRAPSETPYEYRATLAQAFPGCEAEIGLITEAYVAVHYGEAPETPEALEAVRSAWEAIQTAVAAIRAARAKAHGTARRADRRHSPESSIGKRP